MEKEKGEKKKETYSFFATFLSFSVSFVFYDVISRRKEKKMYIERERYADI